MLKPTMPLLAVVLLLAGCSSSSGDADPSVPVPSFSEAVAPPVENASTEADPPAADTETPPSAAGPSNIVDRYDTATCADWAVTSATNQGIVAAYFSVKYAPNLKLPGGTEGVLLESITTACGTDGVPLRATVREVAIASLKLLEQSGS